MYVCTQQLLGSRLNSLVVALGCFVLEHLLVVSLLVLLRHLLEGLLLLRAQRLPAGGRLFHHVCHPQPWLLFQNLNRIVSQDYHRGLANNKCRSAYLISLFLGE